MLVYCTRLWLDGQVTQDRIEGAVSDWIAGRECRERPGAAGAGAALVHRPARDPTGYAPPDLTRKDNATHMYPTALRTTYIPADLALGRRLAAFLGGTLELGTSEYPRAKIQVPDGKPLMFKVDDEHVYVSVCLDDLTLYIRPGDEEISSICYVRTFSERRIIHGLQAMNNTAQRLVRRLRYRKEIYETGDRNILATRARLLEAADSHLAALDPEPVFVRNNPSKHTTLRSTARTVPLLELWAYPDYVDLTLQHVSPDLTVRLIKTFAAWQNERQGARQSKTPVGAQTAPPLPANDAQGNTAQGPDMGGMPSSNAQSAFVIEQNQPGGTR